MGFALYLTLVLTSIAAATAILALARVREAERLAQRNLRDVIAAIGGLRSEVAQAGGGRMNQRAGRSAPFHLGVHFPPPVPERRVVEVTNDDDPIHTRKTVKMAPKPEALTAEEEDELSDSRETLEVTPSPANANASANVANAKEPRSTMVGIGSAEATRADERTTLFPRRAGKLDG